MGGYDPKLDTFGKRLVYAASLRGAPSTQKALSEWFWENHEISVSAAMISKYITNDQLPRILQCRDYAQALGVTVEWLYTGGNEMRPMDPLDPDERELLDLIRSLPTAKERNDLLGYMRVYIKTNLASVETKRGQAAA